MLKTESDVSLVTGFPAFTAKRMARKLFEADPKERIFLLVRPKFRASADEFLGDLGPAARQRVTVVEGDVCDMDLGLSGGEYKEIAAEVTAIHHLAAIYYRGVKREVATRVNIEGTRSVIELALECGRLRRLCHYSTALVSGARSGVILEEELDSGQRFRNFYEETKFRSERLVQDASRRLPTTIFRPGVIVGDSKTGEIDKFDGPYYLLVLIVASPLDVHLPLPGRGSAPLHLVPIDFVVDAAHALGRDPRAVGKTFHLTDPAPFAARTAYELIARSADKKMPRGAIPTALARAVLRAPGLSRLARAPLAFLESFNHLAIYNCRNTLELLDGTGVRCPPLDRYVDALVRYVRQVHAARRQKLEDETFDPFD
ncbi:MAG: NAD-dependent epimerase/dehydratase family protein [Myxococcales bacterium]|nr:NAD-dependent epimerase/dehydratase family protein [Myxococcales bacterium]